MARPIVENLIRAGALDELPALVGRAPAHDTRNVRRELLWTLGGLVYQQEGLDLEATVEPIELPVLGQVERTLWEYELLGLTPGEHLIGAYRERLRAREVLSSAELASRRNGDRVLVAGLVIMRQRPPSAKGFVFVTMEDEEGLINLIVRAKVYERYKDALRNEPLLLVRGDVSREGEAINVQVHQAVALFKRGQP
jgi:error-prone DNA polymerase